MIGKRRKFGKCESAILSGFIILILFGATLLLIPNGIDMRIQRPMNFTFIMTVSAALYILVAVDWILGLLVLWACFHLLVGGPRNDEYLLFAFSIFFIAVVKLRGHLNWDAAYDALMLFVTLHVGYQVWQFFGYSPLLTPTTHYTGLMGNQDDISCFLAVALPVFMRYGRKKWIWIPVLGLFLAKAWMGVIAVSVVLFIIALRKEDTLARGAVMMVAFTAVLVFNFYVKSFHPNQHLANRGTIWKEAAIVAIEKPFGWGFAQFQAVMPLLTSNKYLVQSDKEKLWAMVKDKPAIERAAQAISGGDMAYFKGPRQQKADQVWLEAHNEYVEWFFIAGIPGILLLAMFVFSTGWKAFRSPGVSAYGLLASCVCAMFFFSWQLTPVQALTVFYLGEVYS